MQVRTARRIEDVPPEEWNRLQGTINPFLRHEFLAALERHGAAAPTNGWQPLHLLLEDDAGILLGAAPAYLKGNSWGEFVFDWSWASAYQRAGMAYYPKLLLAVPYTPATGPRVLTAEAMDASTVCRHLAAAAAELCRRHEWSGAHCLFPLPSQAETLRRDGWLRRDGCQFHWRNQGYTSFDDFLGTLGARKRKNIRRERRLAREAGLSFQVVSGDQVTEADWLTFHAFYARTFEAHGNLPVLSPAFFREIGASLAESVQMVQARVAGRLTGAALLLISRDTLYGRYWGCEQERPGMHFETCYYQGIDYCIREGLEWFEPGAQGEHKVARGFLPRRTCSVHWIADERFSAAIAEFLERETPMIHSYMLETRGHSPYKDGCGPDVD